MSQLPLLTDRQCRLFLKDIHEFGYTNVTFEEVRGIANQIHTGNDDHGDVVSIIMRQQIEEAVENN